MVFIDETWAKTNMTRTHGWCTKGEPLIDKVPHGHWKTLTFIAGLKHDGMIAVMDNLGSHKGRKVRELLRKAGIKLFFLPPYSPDLNPIEQVFAKLKRLLRKANERTVEATWRRIGKLLDRFAPYECANYIRGAGYASI